MRRLISVAVWWLWTCNVACAHENDGDRKTDRAQYPTTNTARRLKQDSLRHRKRRQILDDKADRDGYRRKLPWSRIQGQGPSRGQGLEAFALPVIPVLRKHSHSSSSRMSKLSKKMYFNSGPDYQQGSTKPIHRRTPKPIYRPTPKPTYRPTPKPTYKPTYRPTPCPIEISWKGKMMKCTDKRTSAPTRFSVAPGGPTSNGGGSGSDGTPAPYPSPGGGPGNGGTPAPNPAPGGPGGGGGPGNGGTLAPNPAPGGPGGGGGSGNGGTPAPNPAPEGPGGGPGTPAAPTEVQQCQARDRTEVLEELFSEVTDLELLDDDDTPQGQAFEWIDGFDTVDPCTYPTVTDRFALVTFFYSTGGESWSNRTGWLSGAPECEWHGISCDDDDGRVTGLYLIKNNLSGSLPSEMAVLVSLRDIYLANNTLIGNFPESLGSLRLQEIDVEGNQMTGDPFPILTQIPNLSRLRISSNEFNGSLPPTIVVWDRMVEFWLAENSFSGTLPEAIGEMVNLQTLFLYDNQFTGSLPTTLGNLRMFAFQVHQNQLSGEIPAQFYNNVDLSFLRLDVNNFSGSLTGDLGRLTELEDLRLANNSFTGVLPPSFYGLNRLRNVVFRHNQFSGAIRDSFGLWEDLDFFDIAYNNFGGLIPRSLFDIPTLRIAYLHFNNFQGSLPDNYGNPPILRDLYLNQNQLRGNIPAIQENQLQQLSEFLLHDNLFTGVMPASVCSLRTSGDLEDLFADCNPPDAPEVLCPRPSCCNQCFPLIS